MDLRELHLNIAVKGFNEGKSLPEIVFMLLNENKHLSADNLQSYIVKTINDAAKQNLKDEIDPQLIAGLLSSKSIMLRPVEEVISKCQIWTFCTK